MLTEDLNETEDDVFTLEIGMQFLSPQGLKCVYLALQQEQSDLLRQIRATGAFGDSAKAAKSITFVNHSIYQIERYLEHKRHAQ